MTDSPPQTAQLIARPYMTAGLSCWGCMAVSQVTTVVGNCPGFVGNRMLFPYKNETDFLVEEGASPYEVDR